MDPNKPSQQALTASGAKPVCYVCGKEIKGGCQYIGQAMYRHSRCEPGSARYMARPRLARQFNRLLRTRRGDV